MLRVVVIAGAERLCTGRSSNGIALAQWLRGPRYLAMNDENPQ